MATASVTGSSLRVPSWFWDFLKGELAPYPGRWALVARIVIAATITMLVTMIFRIPGGAAGAVIAFVISRENLVATTKSVVAIGTALLMAVAFVPVGARMFASIPMTHFVWEGISLFLIFFLIRTLSNFAVAGIIGLIGTSILGVWYLPGPASYNLEQTLWQVMSPAVAALSTVVVEVVFHAFQKHDQIFIGTTARLQTMEDLLRCYAGDKPIPQEISARLTQYATIGVGTLRRMLARARYTNRYRAQMSAVISLTGRAVDFAAALAHTQPFVSQADQVLAAKLTAEVAAVRNFLLTGEKPPIFETEATPVHDSLLRELEVMVALMPRVIEGSASLESFQSPAMEPEPEPGVLLPDAFTNPEHVRFALSGCLAGSLCYIIYVGLAWPGLTTSVTTCVLTALSTIGASRQKQVLRVIGAIIGGFGFGLGAQLFILPNIDTITGFTLLFVAVTAVAAWVATSSSRLSYCGLQIALAFYLIHLNDFTIQRSLTIARDRTLGVLLGISMMWLVFEKLQPSSATNEMVKIFNQNLRLLAELAVYSARPRTEPTIAAARRLRDQIYNNFSAVNSQADAVPFEGGPQRLQHMAARDRIRRWQAALRTAYLLQLALLQYRVFGSTERLSPESEALLQGFDESCAHTLKDMADYLEAQRVKAASGRVEIHPPALPVELAAGAGLETALGRAMPANLLSLAHELLKILQHLREQMLAQPLYATE